MLETIHHQRVGNYRLSLRLLGCVRFFDQRDCELYLIDEDNRESKEPIFRGRYNSGWPSIYVPGWIDGEFLEPSFYGSLTDAMLDDIYIDIAKTLGGLIPPGGRFWIAYEGFHHDGWLQRETRAALNAGVPPVCTPIGHLLFCADCWLGIRNWDIPEGGREGYRKLQGNRALHQQHAHQRASELIEELTRFLEGNADDPTIRRAQVRGAALLPQLQVLRQIITQQVTNARHHLVRSG